MDAIDKESLVSEICEKLAMFGKSNAVTERAVMSAVESFFTKYSGLIFSGKTLSQLASKNGFLISQDKAVKLMENTLNGFKEIEGEISGEFLKNLRDCDDVIDLSDDAALVAFALERERVFNEDDISNFRREVSGKTLEEAALVCLYHGASVEENLNQQSGRKI